MAAGFDLVVYGGTSAGVVAAIAGSHMGLRVALVSPDRHLGGLTASGLGWTDSKDGRAVGGLARVFYHRIWRHYRSEAAWTRSRRDDYAARVRAQPGPTIDDVQQVMWTFEPSAAEAIFERWLEESNVHVVRDARLDRARGVEVRAKRIERLRTLEGHVLDASVWIDASYEGDLAATAGITCRIGRDSAAEYHEPLAGICFFSGSRIPSISPYIVPNDPESGLLAGIEGEMPAHERLGDSDSRLQSFNYRLTLTKEPANRIPISKPAGYDERQFEMLLRLYESGEGAGWTTHEMPNGKTDSNSQGVVSLDLIGGSAGYSEGSYEDRARIAEAHRRYAQGVLWTVMHHPRIPEAERQKWAGWGLAADEYPDNGHWPRQLYVREARRMVGEMVMTQQHVEQAPGFDIHDPIGMGSYSLDSHGVRRVVLNGKMRTEGSFYQRCDAPYPISYRSIIPRRTEIQNLLNPVTLSASHVAFGSIRMEPTYMLLSHSAAVAAALAIRARSAVQDVPYDMLKDHLLEQRQILTL